MYDWMYYLHCILSFLDKINLDEILKLLLLAIGVAAVVFSVLSLWPVWLSYLKIYDITVVNRLEECCKHSLMKAWCGNECMQGCDDMNISPLHTVHIQIVPKLRGIFGSYTHHLSVKRTDGRWVVIPIYNSGDIQRSRVFVIEDAGIRETCNQPQDAWIWSANHHFGQTS